MASFYFSTHLTIKQTLMKKILLISYLVFALLSASGQTTISVIKPYGGRVDWRTTNNQIAYDMTDLSGYFNVYKTDTSGIPTINITNKPNAPQKHKGNPTWHPSGDWIIFQAEIDTIPDLLDPVATPGIGAYNNLWATDSAGNQFWQLTFLPPTFPATGVLHPHFSNNGTKVVWAQMLDNSGPNNNWFIKIADFVVTSGVPSLQNIQTLHPGTTFPTLYETHGFSPGDSIITFSSTINNPRLYEWDVFTYNLNSSQLTNLTNSTDWDEFASISPEGTKIVWATSKNITWDTAYIESLRMEWWQMDVNGDNKTQLTHFNTVGFPEYTPGRNTAADLSWGTTGNEFIGLVQGNNPAFGKDVKVTINTTGLNDVTIDNEILIRIFPNPFTYFTTFSFGTTVVNAEINIYNSCGEKVKTINHISGDRILIFRENLCQGIYFYELKQDKYIFTGKLLIVD